MYAVHLQMKSTIELNAVIQRNVFETTSAFA
jgi:hypothetical protein